MKKQNQKIFIFLLLCLLVESFFVGERVKAYGAPDYLPDGPHPRIWLTPSVIAELKTKRAANTSDWQNLVSRSSVFSSYLNNQPYRLDWPGGAGYAGSGFQDALMTWGLMYYAYKTDAYGTVSETADDVIARTYAQNAVDLLNKMIVYFSSGEEQDGIDLVRMNDRLYMFNADEKNINAVLAGSATPSLAYRGGQTRLLTYKNGYAARTTGEVLPIVYDWFYNDPLFTPTLKTTLYKMMFRHIDWFRGVRSTYNNGILINGIRYHEDKSGDCSGNNNCNINDTSDHALRRQSGYSFGKMGANFYESFVGMAMLTPLAVYGDAPQADADNYLLYAKQLWAEQKQVTESAVGFKGGDSPEGIYYNSSWNNLLEGILGLKNATGMDVFSAYDFPKEIASNILNNTYSSLDKVIHRGAWSSSQANQWMVPISQQINVVSHVLRNYYNEPSEGKLLQQYLNVSTIPYQGQAWEKFLWRNDSNAATKDLATQPLYYRAIGTGTETLRSSWNQATTDTVLAQISLKGSQRTDHEQQGDGYLTLSRGADRLLSRLKYSNGQDEEQAVGQNTLVFNDSDNIVSPISDPDFTNHLTAPAIDREQHNQNFDYLSADITNSWKYNTSLFPSNQDMARYLKRSLVYLRPNLFLVHDTARSNSNVGNTKKEYFQLEAAPIIDNASQNLSVQVGNSKLFAKVLFPVGGSFNDTDLSSQSNTNVSTVFHRVSYSPASANEYDQFLQLFQASGKNESQTPSTMITSIQNNMLGAYIQDQTSPTVVMFSSDQNGNDVAGNITYSIDTANQTISHILVNLLIDTQYTVKTTNNSNIQTIEIIQGSGLGQGTVYTTSSQGVLNFQSVSQSANFSVSDFTTLVSNWLHFGTISDINIDGKVNAKDLGIMMSKWN